MSDGTKIEWTDATWNVVNGCSVVSPGCTNCYAMKQAHRFPARQGLTQQSKGGMVWTGEVRFNEAVLLHPLRWRRPRKIFVCAHGDLFHEKVPDEWIDRVFDVMCGAKQHVFQVLTKRPERMRSYIKSFRLSPLGFLTRNGEEPTSYGGSARDSIMPNERWPLPNVWLGTSVEDQVRADERIPILLDTPAAMRWLSCEPLLGAVDLTQLRTGLAGQRMCALSGYWRGAGVGAGTPTGSGKIDWVVAGGESGPGARPMHPAWARSLRDQCAAACVPFLFKQWGEHRPWADGDPDRPSLTTAWPDGSFGDGSWEQKGGYGEAIMRLGKKATGRLLDGVQHDGYPA